ncbi:hypothetical protein FKP32DRAFT_1671612 [Trametes sanguinea]|nr:hypothetical protein FKP32DRAFT_1671612 [Trametes sanguinea]
MPSLSRESSPSLSNIIDELDSLLSIPVGGYRDANAHVLHDSEPLTGEDNPADDFAPLIDLHDCGTPSPGLSTSRTSTANAAFLDASFSEENMLVDTDKVAGALQTPGSPTSTISISSARKHSLSVLISKSYDNWDGATLYARILENLGTLLPASAELLEAVTRLTHKSSDAEQVASMDSRVLRGIAEVESYLRTARNALVRGESTAPSIRKGNSLRIIRGLRSKLAAARAQAANLKARHTRSQRRIEDLELSRPSAHGLATCSNPSPPSQSLSQDGGSPLKEPPRRATERPLVHRPVRKDASHAADRLDAPLQDFMVAGHTAAISEDVAMKNTSPLFERTGIASRGMDPDLAIIDFGHGERNGPSPVAESTVTALGPSHLLVI